MEVWECPPKNKCVFHYLWSNALLNESEDNFEELWEIEKEPEYLLQIFHETHTKISFRSAPASTFEIKFGATNASIVHFSGHGFKVEGKNDFLGFEYYFDPYHQMLGSIYRFKVGDIQDLFDSSKPELIPKLICLCACHSELIGEAFVEIGVRHVIAIRRCEVMFSD
jgi:CHAT domain-containing protein